MKQISEEEIIKIKDALRNRHTLGVLNILNNLKNVEIIKNETTN